MTLRLFPVPNSQSWSVVKSPNWATRMQRSISGRELRVADYMYPLFTWTLTFEVLRDPWDVRAGPGIGYAYPIGHPAYDEMRTIWYFLAGQQGAQLPFRYYDPTDFDTRSFPATSTPVSLWTYGDGVTTTFPIAGSLRSPVIPGTIRAVQPSGISYSIDNDRGLLIFASPPAAGVPVGMDMTYWQRVRFATDAIEAENFMYQLWTVKQLKLVSVLD